MKCGNTFDVIHKEVVIIGNGPSGIVLSYMLSGNLPYLISDSHPDEMLSARLRPFVGQCLVQQDLEELSAGLEGRSTNQVSLLFDALQHPCADIGLEMEPLIEFRKAGIEIDHVVLGKGPPGGSWHKMDPYVLTLSLGSWMALPGLPFHSRDSGEKRAYACNVAKYYVQYVEQMNLSKYLRNNVSVTRVECVDSGVPSKMVEVMELVEETEICSSISNVFSRLFWRSKKPTKQRCKRSVREDVRKLKAETTVPKNIRRETKRSISLTSCDSSILCDNLLYSKSYNNDSSSSFNRYSLRSLDSPKHPMPSSYAFDCDCSDRWIVTSTDNETGETTNYSCKYLVLANGASDLPNRLGLSMMERDDPEWLVHDLRSLEWRLDGYMRDKVVEEVDPVLIVGAGLSAADAVIAVRGRNIPVVHAFRNKSADLNKQLPENMYPEYHKVHQMMQDGGSTYPLYNAYPEHSLTDINPSTRTATLTSKSGDKVKLTVSFVAVLIGSRPDLRFLPNHSTVGVHKNLPIDCKTNTVDIEKLTHKVVGCENLFAVGPLAGDNFVRFIPGGAVAVLSELYRHNRVNH